MARRLDLTPTTAFWAFVGLLALCGLFFAVQVERARSARGEVPLRQGLAAGDPVSLMTVIDGDELTVRRGETPFVVRLLGVRCPTGDAGGALAGVASLCRDALAGAVAGVSLSLDFDPDGPRVDRHGRVLAYLHADGVDVGQGLLRRGALVVYQAHPFGREADYRATEDEARAAHRGLWARADQVARITALQLGWAAERGD